MAGITIDNQYISLKDYIKEKKNIFILIMFGSFKYSRALRIGVPITILYTIVGLHGWLVPEWWNIDANANIMMWVLGLIAPVVGAIGLGADRSMVRYAKEWRYMGYLYYPEVDEESKKIIKQVLR